MKQVIALLFAISIYHNIHAQAKQSPKPQFFSVVTLEEPVGDYQLISNYYPLKDNIDNKASVVYVSDTPTLDEIEKAAINLPSDFFIVSRNKVGQNKVMLINKPVRNYFVA